MSKTNSLVVRIWRVVRRIVTTNWAFVRREIWVWRSWFVWALPYEAVNLAIGLASWVYFGRMFGVSQIPALQPYGGDFLSYLIVGVAFSSLLGYCLMGYYRSLRAAVLSTASFGGSKMSYLEYLSLSQVSPAMFLLTQIVWGFIQNIMFALAYLVAGVALFGLRLSPQADYGLAAIATLLGIVATSSIGLISASTIGLLGTWHGNEPIQWLVGLLASVGSGTYFPPEILPSWALSLSMLLPQTRALAIVRLALLGSATVETIVPHLEVLVLYCLLFIPAILLLGRSVERMRSRGVII